VIDIILDNEKFVGVSIFCIGLNYKKHWEESARKRGVPYPKHPALFMKPTSSICHPGEDIWMPQIKNGDCLDYEAELVIVIGKPGRNIPRDQALNHVLGFCCGHDVSSRWWQRNNSGQWIRGKSFDRHAPFGPVMAVSSSIDSSKLQISSIVNHEVRQNSNTSDMIFSVPEIIEWISQDTTLLPGTIIFTGTPEGVGVGFEPKRYLKAGDQVTVSISGIGTLTNKIVNAPVKSKL